MEQSHKTIWIKKKGENTKVLKDRLTANLKMAMSHMSFLGQYERAVNIIIDQIISSGNRIDRVAYPLLYVIRHSLELGYKANLECLTKYSKKPLSKRILKHHNLATLHQEFK